MAKKFYAIKEGYDSVADKKVENVIVHTWNECLEYVKGVKGAKYKSFESEEDARDYLNDSDKILKKGVDKYPEDCLHVYVDGSFNDETKRYSYGLVAVRNNVVEFIDGGSPKDTSQSNIRQVAGELVGAVKAVRYALSKGDKRMCLMFDYAGVASHSLGIWERKDASSQKYYEVMSGLFKQGIEVIFVKIDSHTGDLYNELADEVCKYMVNIESDKVVDNWLSKNKMYVETDAIKHKILKLVPTKADSIVVVDDKVETSSEIKQTVDIEAKLSEVMEKLSDDKKLDVLKYAKQLL